MFVVGVGEQLERVEEAVAGCLVHFIMNGDGRGESGEADALLLEVGFVVGIAEDVGACASHGYLLYDLLSDFLPEEVDFGCYVAVVSLCHELFVFLLLGSEESGEVWDGIDGGVVSVFEEEELI